MPDAPVSDFLAFSARIVCSDTDVEQLFTLAGRIREWDGFAGEAEAHGIAPLVDMHCDRAGICLPAGVRRQLRALTLRHRLASEIYARTLCEILDAFDAAGIQAVVLKGAALAHVLYPFPALRPMSDIDLLVDPRCSIRAQTLLSELGFDAPVTPPIRRLARHHHLPPATKRVDGHEVQVEVHVDALSPDCSASLTTRQLGILRRFSINGRTAATLGHEDMLYHLCRHMAERGSRLRLIWVADTVGYALRFDEDIDWSRLEQRCPFVLNALSLLHHVSPLPPRLLERPIPTAPQAAGAGTVPGSLLTTVRVDRPVRETLRELLQPSEWWLRLYYGVRASGPLWWYRWVRHPAQVSKWLLRRAWIYACWRPEVVR